MATRTTIKQQSTKRGSKRNGGDGDGDDIGGGGGNTAIAVMATAMAVMVAGSCRRFEVRKANRKIKNLFRCICMEYYL
jgi:hypothetical protein